MKATESSGEALPEAIDALHWALQAATTQFPSGDEEVPIAVRPSASGPRGVFALAHRPGYVFPDPTVIGRQMIPESLQLASTDDLDPHLCCAHRGFDVGSYTDPDDRARAVTLRSAIEAGTFRFDASDQLPPSVANQFYPGVT